MIITRSWTSVALALCRPDYRLCMLWSKCLPNLLLNISRQRTLSQLRTLSNMNFDPASSDESICISLKDVQEARERIKNKVHYTPVMESSYLNSLTGLQLFFKCEQFQKTGSFKIRGATNTIIKLVKKASDTGKEMPIAVTHSSGNHAQAVALASKLSGIPAQIVMPRTSPTIKVRAVEGYGGVVTLCVPSEQGRRDAAAAIMKSVGPRAVLIQSSNHPDIMAGQGTISLEMLEQVPDLDAIVASVSAGGFVAGICVAAKALKPGIKVFAAEPELADDCAKSFAAGKIIPNKTFPNTIADALKMSVCDLTFPIIKKHVSAVITVSEEEIIAAMRLVWERMKVVIEPAAACSVAAVLSDKFKKEAGSEIKNVGVVLCGGNLDLDNIPWIK